MYEGYQKRFGVKTPYEVRREALFLETPKQYPILENKKIIKYKLEHYTSSPTLTSPIFVLALKRKIEHVEL